LNSQTRNSIIDAVDDALLPYWDRIGALGIESTFNWYWLVDGLVDRGRTVWLGKRKVDRCIFK
jgi:transposase